MKRSGVGRRKRNVLDAIPFDDWISPSEIGEKTGMRPQTVGIIISKCLMPVFVEKKEDGVPNSKNFIYKRITLFDEPKRPRD